MKKILNPYGLTLLFLITFFSCSKDDIEIDNSNNDLTASNTSMASSATPTDGKTYYIKSVHSGKYIDVDGYSTDNGGNIHQWSYTGNTNQQWEVISNGSNYRLISVYSGKALEVSGYSNSNGGNIQQWGYVGNDYQKFTFTGSSSDGYQMICQGSGKVIDVASWSTDNGGNLHQWTDNNTNNQKWEFIEVSSSSSSTAPTVSVDFDDLEVETSWISEDTGDRDAFDASNVDNEEWMDVYSTGIVMMKCLAADSHRTELKEASGDEASLSTSKQMSYTATVTSIPAHGVTIAQIHNRGGVKRPFIRVFIDDDRVIRIKETETTPDESSSTYSEYDGPSYTSGDDLTITINTSGGSAAISIITGGNSYSKTVTPSSDWNDFSDDYYLKAGVYTEGDDTEPKINFSSFSINH